MVAYFSQHISVKVKKILRKSEPQFWEKVRKLRLRHKVVFLYQKNVNIAVNCTREYTYLCE